LEKAKRSWQAAAASSESEGRRRRGGGGGAGFAPNRAVQRYYQALAQRKLGQNDQAIAIFQELVKAGRPAQADSDSEAVPPSAVRQNQRSRSAAVHYAAGLGHLGLGEKEQAKAEFKRALAECPDHLGATVSLRRLAPEK
jgi:tetratricopeptide (TPR) repeat protein